MKKQIKTEEEMKKTKILFKQKWTEIAAEERSPGLKGVFSKYANGV